MIEINKTCTNYEIVIIILSFNYSDCKLGVKSHYKVNIPKTEKQLKMCKNGHKLLYLYVAGTLRVTHERARQPAREEHPISVPLDLTSVQMQPADSSVAHCWLSSCRHCKQV